MITNDGKDKMRDEARVLMNRPLRAEAHFFDAETDEHLFSVTNTVILNPGDSYVIKYPDDGFEFTVS